MMINVRPPGVVYERVDTPPAVGLHRTDIAGFVGIAARGPLHHPVKIESWTQFTSQFGAHLPQGFLAYAVEGFFANGGRTAYIVRVADSHSPEKARPASRNLAGPGGALLRLEATSPGVWGQGIAVQTVQTGIGLFTLILRLGEAEYEIWRSLPLADLPAVQAQLNDLTAGSRLVRAESPSGQEPPRLALDVFATGTASGYLLGGSDGLATLTLEHYAGRAPDGAREPWGLTALEYVDQVAIVVMPDAVFQRPAIEPQPEPPGPRCDALEAELVFQPPVLPGDFPPAFDAADMHELHLRLIAHCTRLHDRFAIIDPPPPTLADGVRTPADADAWRNGFDTTFAAAYYPWLRVPDPLRLDGPLRLVPPSGYVAGLYARSDRQIGVHKPPANTVMDGAQDVAASVDDIAHAHLNGAGINVIRSYAGRGIRVAGARTLSTAAEWRYINVRRLFLMLEEAIEESCQWIVFEPGNTTLWRQVERVVRNVLRTMWQRGMLDGASPDDAFRVRCDAATNPPDQTAQGRMICQIDLCAPYPAEFVTVRVGFTETGVALLE